LSRASARLRDVEASTRFPRSRHDSETRLSKKNSASSRRRLGPERKRHMQIWRELLLPSGKYVRAERRRKVKKREYSRS
jgi:hypothetical protein